MNAKDWQRTVPINCLESDKDIKPPVKPSVNRGFLFRGFGLKGLKIEMVMFEKGYVVDIVFYNII